jgi:HSP20 family protein
MAIVRWQPARELSSLQNDMNRLFGSFSAPVTARRWVPAMDLVEADDHYELKADLPGVAEEDVKVEFEDRVLTISGERRSESEQRTGGYVRVERASGSFRRSLTVPAGTDGSAITADFSNGVLQVSIPKPAERKPHRVAIGTQTVEPAESTPTQEPVAA